MAKSTATITPINAMDSNDAGYPVAVPNPLDIRSDLFRECLERRKQNHQALLEYIQSTFVEGRE